MSKRPLTYTYTGDLNAHDRCKRAWAYEKHLHFSQYEQVQAVYGNLYHAILEWLAKSHMEFRAGARAEPTSKEFGKVIIKQLRMLRARGIKSRVERDDAIQKNILSRIFPSHTTAAPTTVMHPDFDRVIKSAERTEQDLKAPIDLKAELPSWNAKTFRDHSQLHLRGIVDVVRMLDNPMEYDEVWEWDKSKKSGKKVSRKIKGKKGELELWDYKATDYDPEHIEQYVTQMLTYAHIYEKTHNERPNRCILFFINEVRPPSVKQRPERFLVIEADDAAVNQVCYTWTLNQVEGIQKSINKFESDPNSLMGGDAHDILDSSVAEKQCIVCMKRWGCETYSGWYNKNKKKDPPDADLYAIN